MAELVLEIDPEELLVSMGRWHPDASLTFRELCASVVLHLALEGEADAVGLIAKELCFLPVQVRHWASGRVVPPAMTQKYAVRELHRLLTRRRDPPSRK